MTNRREFLKTLMVGGSAVLVPSLSFGRPALDLMGWSSQPADIAWSQVPIILNRIKPPVFPKRDFSVTRFGARGDGKVDCTDAFRKAIAACNKAGGGRVVVPGGDFLTGPIHLLSNVNLHLQAGATIVRSRPCKNICRWFLVAGKAWS